MVTRLELAPDLVIWQGDVREVLPQLPSESVQCVVTSPPYYGLRDYGVAGQIGLEPTVEEYVHTLVEVFREVRRVLRKDGTLWLNLGDSYTSGGRSTYDADDKLPARRSNRRPKTPNGLKPKDLIGVPWRVAFALQADGWYLRSDIIWAKANPLPESVTDRPTRSHEYIFLLTKSVRYFYDAAAIAEPSTGQQSGNKVRVLGEDRGRPGSARVVSFPYEPTGTRNKRTVWTIPTEPTPFAHFATFPQALVEPCILAGTSPMACPHCGAPWKRVVEVEWGQGEGKPYDSKRPDGLVFRGRNRHSKRIELGWQPTCSCEGNDGSGRCIVLDPFWGSGTTGLVALQHGRIAWGIELNPAYVEISKRRLLGTQTTLLGRV